MSTEPIPDTCERVGPVTDLPGKLNLLAEDRFRDRAEYPGRNIVGELTAKSAATGRPHYFGRLYEDGAECVWCGNTEQHGWHLR